MTDAMTSEPDSRSGTIGLLRNTGWNLTGQIVPLFVAVFTIPGFMRHMGTDRFGVLTIAWSVLAYFSLFDFGLGRAVTVLAAEKIGANRQSEVAPLAWTALAIMAVLGIFAGVLAVAASPLLIHYVFHVPSELQSESIVACTLLGLSLPFVIVTTGLSGILAGVERFDVLNQLRMPQGTLSFIAPWAVALWYPNLSAVVAAMVLVRVAFCLIHLFYCVRVIPDLSSHIGVQKRYVRPLLNFGGWATVSNVVGPVMIYFDRFLIGAWLSVGAVGYYATPHEALNRLLVVPIAVSTVLVPAIAGSWEKDVSLATKLLARAMDLTTVLLFPVAAFAIMFANEMLTLWLGASFAQNSFRVLQLLMIGVFVNGFAQVGFAVVQGAGRADLTAKFHLLELPVYIALLWYLLSRFGVVGAALAWTLRTLLDMTLLFGATAYLNHERRQTVWKKFSEAVLLGAMLVGCMFIPANEYWRLAALACVASLYLGYGWRVILRGVRPADLAPYMRMLWAGQ
jgi:O-antigen/teichoic acid export membrane protein